LTLDEVVSDEVNDWRPGDTWHRAVWHGRELLVVIRPGPGGKAEVVRLHDTRRGD